MSTPSIQKVVLITGSTAGIGRATALHLARLGNHVIATGRKLDLLEALRREALAEGPGRFDIALLDVTNPASIAHAAAEIETLTGGHGVDVLINNAGFGYAGPLAEQDDAAVRAQFETNVFGLMAVTRAFLPAMMRRRAGRIVNVSSIGGRVTFPFFGAYHGTKYAVEAMSDALRYELQPFGVDVVVIEPGPIKTNFGDTAMTKIGAFAGSPYAPAIAQADAIRQQFEKRAAPPEAVAKVIGRVLAQRRPSARYAAPFYNGAIFLLNRVTPTFVWDWAVRRLGRLTPEHLGVTAAPPAAPVPTPAPAQRATSTHAVN